MSKCLSVLGPPPGCGHEPTATEPFCLYCTKSWDDYERKAHEQAIRDAKRYLESHGYRVINPED